jgi:tetratricopeptide (TPR) repeat protein
MRSRPFSPDAGLSGRLAVAVFSLTGLVVLLVPARARAGEDLLVNASQSPTQVDTAAAMSGSSGLSPEAWGDILMARRNYVAAIEAYRQGPPHTATQWNKIGVAYHHLFALDEARKDYLKALSIDPKNPDALNDLGTVYHARRSYRKAIHYYKKALKYQPRSAPIYCNLGTTYFAEGKWSKGERAYEQAFALDPSVFDPNSGRWIEDKGPARERAALHYALAKMYAKSGKRDLAMDYLRKAVDEGFRDKKKMLEEPELATLRDMPEFKQLTADQ